MLADQHLAYLSRACIERSAKNGLLMPQFARDTLHEIRAGGFAKAVDEFIPKIGNTARPILEKTISSSPRSVSPCPQSVRGA
ncbi:MAG: hypothetical protein ACI80I_000700 [Akkermansiaceae bacterium]|jgi:hypothetical protein